MENQQTSTTNQKTYSFHDFDRLIISLVGMPGMYYPKHLPTMFIDNIFTFIALNPKLGDPQNHEFQYQNCLTWDDLGIPPWLRKPPLVPDLIGFVLETLGTCKSAGQSSSDPFHPTGSSMGFCAPGNVEPKWAQGKSLEEHWLGMSIWLRMSAEENHQDIIM